VSWPLGNARRLNVPIIPRWLEEDQASTGRQRHTAERVWERLRDEHGLTGAESTVLVWRQTVGRWHEGQAS
jgi:hypothetical protein